MRPVLIRILIDDPLSWFTTETAPLAIGSIWVILFVMAAYVLGRKLFGKPWTLAEKEPLVWFVGTSIVAGLIAPRIVSDGLSVPIFGYGVMILVGFLAGTLVAQWRLRTLGYDGELAFSIGTWVLISGVVGARLFFLFQHGGEAIGNAPTLAAKLFVIVNLSNGGLVLYGGVFAGLAAFLWFCHSHKIPALRMADVCTPSVFLGIGFGRLGCLLYGCCFGGQCDLPWAITFPADSITYQTMAQRGVIEVGQVVALHPTQIYSSISGFLLAALTAAFFRHRIGDGAVFAIGCMTYPIHRFIVEYLRNDELGQLGTSLTISQLISLVVVVAGAGLFFHATRKPVGSKAPNSTAVA